MKRLFALLLFMAFAGAVSGQGIIYFNNRVPGLVDAKIYYDYTYTIPLTGSEFHAALLGGPTTRTPASVAGPGTLKQLSNPDNGYVSAVTFRTGAAAGYVSNVNTARDSQLAYGSTGMFQVVIWQGNYSTWPEAYEAMFLPGSTVKVGWSNPVNVTVTANPLDTATPYLIGLQSFAFFSIPEPSSMALAGLGAAALLIFRRRK